jgi:hypothetical protein
MGRPAARLLRPSSHRARRPQDDRADSCQRCAQTVPLAPRRKSKPPVVRRNLTGASLPAVFDPPGSGRWRPAESSTRSAVAGP